MNSGTKIQPNRYTQTDKQVNRLTNYDSFVTLRITRPRNGCTENFFHLTRNILSDQRPYCVTPMKFTVTFTISLYPHLIPHDRKKVMKTNIVPSILDNKASELIINADPTYLPTIVIIQATTYDNEPIQTIHIINVKGNQFLKRGFSQSGIVKRNTKCIGHVTNHVV